MTGIPCRIVIFGPAYLDRILETGDPLLSVAVRRAFFLQEPLTSLLKKQASENVTAGFADYISHTTFPIDWSVAASRRFPSESASIEISSPPGDHFVLKLPTDAPNDLKLKVDLADGIVQPAEAGRYLERFLNITLSRDSLIYQWIKANPLTLKGRWPVTRWREDPGGMGAGYAAALGGELLYACGAEDSGACDAVGMKVRDALMNYGARVCACPLRGHQSDETLLLSSGQHGDKLPIGFRDAVHHYPVEEAIRRIPGADLIVIASLPNNLVTQLLQSCSGKPVLFAPAMRNVAEPDFPIDAIKAHVFCLTLNENEWRRIPGRDSLKPSLPLLFITQGSEGAQIHFQNESGKHDTIHVPAFHPEISPRDTNRAGETFAAFTLRRLLKFSGIAWFNKRAFKRDEIEAAGFYGAAAAHLQIQREEFGFPDEGEVDSLVG